MTTAMVATAIPFVLQIMNISGWILEVGSNVFRQIGTARDSMQTIAQAADPGRRAGRRRRSSSAAARSSSTGSASTTGAATPGAVVHDFSLTVHPGEKIGLVGRSGAGKSTLVNLTLRHVRRRPRARSASTARTSASVTQESLRRAIGVVGQDTSLLHRSVRENIKFGSRSASRRGDDRGGEAGAACTR